MFIVSGSTSTSTGRGRRARRRSPSPGRCRPGRAPRRRARARARARARCSAAVPDETATACSRSHARASSSSNSRDLGPIVSCPVSSTVADRVELVRARRRAGARRIPLAPASRLVPRDRPREAVVELDLRLEAEQLARLVHVRDAQLDVGVVERREDDLARAAGEPLDPRREVVDRDRRARVADVEASRRPPRALEAEQHAVDHVVDVAPGADLRAVAVDRQVAAGERRLDERADRAAADLAGPVDVERADRTRRAAPSSSW